MEVRVLIRHCKRVRFQVDPAVTHSQDDLSHLQFPSPDSVNRFQALEKAFEQIPLLLGEGEKLKAVLTSSAVADHCPYIPRMGCFRKQEAEANHLAAVQFRRQDYADPGC
ncbi:MAG: hypothetical protein WAN19_07205 [Candidatus Sulfotelmatobacter sp.]